MCRRHRLGVVVALGLAACPANSTPTTCPDPSPARAGSPRAAQTPDVAPTPDLAALQSRVAALATESGLKPKPRGPAPLIARLEPGRAWYPTVWQLQPKAQDPKPIEALELFFTREPRGTLAPDGTLTVRWSTRDSTEPGLVYFGIRVEEDPLAGPRYRKQARATGKGKVSDHEAALVLPTLLREKYDVNRIAERGYGEVAWRVEVFDPDRGTTVLYDGRTAFRLDGTRFVQTPTVVIGPLVHQVSESEATISFETDVPTVALVGVAKGRPAESPTASTRHEIAVTGLKSAMVHPYAVAVSDGVETSLSSVHQFSTLDPSAPLSVAIMSDSRSGIGPGDEAYAGSNADALQSLFPSAVRHGADAIFFPGDLIDGYVTQEDAYDWQLRAWLKAVEGVHGRLPVYTGMGNHESLFDAWSDGLVLDKAGAASAEAHFAALMVNPNNGPEREVEGAPDYDESVYSVDLGSVHFVMLNTNYWYSNPVGHARFEGKGNREGFVMDGQLAWLERDLEAARSRGTAHIVVMGHEPAFPAGGHPQDAMWWNNAIPDVNAMRERFWKILADHDVVAYVTGDEHNYSRTLIGPETVAGASNSVWSIISGGCGAPYYAQDTPAEYADRVEVFSAQQHYTLWTFDGDEVRLQVVGITGEIIDDVLLRGE